MNAQTRIQETSTTLFCSFKEYLMVKKITKFRILIALILLSSSFLSGCGAMSFIGSVIPISQPDVEPELILPPVLGPEAARDAALDFVRVNFGSSAPSREMIWVGGEAPSDGLVGSSNFQYVTTGWVSRISFPLTAPDATIYTVKISQDTPGFSWEGSVDAYGQVVTAIVTIEVPSPTPEVVDPEPTPTPEPTSNPNLEPCNAIEFVTDVTIPDGKIFVPNAEFTKIWGVKNAGYCTWNSDYDLIFIGGNQMGAIQAVDLPTEVMPGESMNISVAMTSPSEVGEYIGLWMLRSADGELFGLGEAANKAFWVSILVADPGSSAPPLEEIFAWEGYIWGTEFGAQYDDYFERTDLGQSLLFGIESMDTEFNEIIVSLRDTGKKVRLGGTLFSNVIDYNGSQIVVTQIEVLAPTPNPEPCNAIQFVADVITPDGTIFAPNVDFTKVWRLKNVGNCTWNDSYDLVFIGGARLNAIKTVALPTKVKPGESVNLSAIMTSPSEVGEHVGLWMLRTTDGELFGLGEAANKAFWVSIRVVDPSSSTPPPEEIFAWEGYIWGTEYGAQYDDYFERTDLGQSLLFGIESMEPELKEVIVSLRDSGKKVHLRGTLYSNVIDYNGSQILITQIEVLE